jgi:Periplasmic protein involved in polysaccharide export
MQKKYLVGVLWLLPWLSSCLTTHQTNLLQDPEGGIPSYPQAEAIKDYLIKPGDELKVRISVAKESAKTETLLNLFSSYNNYAESEQNKIRTLTVSPQGNVYFPYLGDIAVSGKTTLEIQEELQLQINQRLITDEACIVIVTLENRYFSVIGESSAGRYPIAKEQLTIFQALSQSKDVNPYGNRTEVKVIRQTENGACQVRTFDLRSSDIVNSEYYYVQPNDVIYIKPLGRQFWRVNSFGSGFVIVSMLVNLGLIVYKLIAKN